jgi:U3 small nucleolar RNA-associated protein 7
VTFIPYQDVMGIVHDNGYGSILVPGAGQANFDAFEANPFESLT